MRKRARFSPCPIPGGGRSVVTGLVLLASLGGCTVGPHYQVPQLLLPPTWSELPESGVTTQSVKLGEWWTTLKDPVLDSLITQAVRANLDLRVAEGRVREVRAQRGVTAADAWPTINTSGAYSRSRRSENVGTFPSSSVGNDQSSSNSQFGSLESDLLRVGFDASWELDLFGRVRRSVEAAEADIAAAEEDHRDVLVTLLAEVARNYVDLRGFQQQLKVASANIDTQQATVEVTQARFQAGLTSALDVAQAQAQLATTQAQVPTLETEAKQAIHRLGVLLGQEPSALLARLSQARPIPIAALEVSIGLPSELLRRRPDVRRAERALAAATARIGVAMADLFPRFLLTSNTVGLQSASLSDLALGSSRFWTAGSTISWPIFDAGKIRSNIQVQNARQEQALAQYEKAVLTSLEDVENALVAYVREQMRRRALAGAVDANKQAVALANERYTKGLADFLNVLESQRALYMSEDQLVQSERAVATNLVGLYKAMGGGWASSS
jgi:outer membrane protein, multidrug efflux system